MPSSRRLFVGLLAVFISAVHAGVRGAVVSVRAIQHRAVDSVDAVAGDCGRFFGLWATGTELNITAMMGLTMIVGIVTEVSIFYFSEYHELTAQGMPHTEALVQAGVNRMRPILMTTLTAILALLPLALGLGRGSGMQQPLAIAIISGLLVQAPLALILLPALFGRFSQRTSNRTST